MPKIIVTHSNPDLDAIASVWLFKKYGSNFEEAKVIFVPAGCTYQDQKVDDNESIVHVDTGLGKFDHHQLSQKISASQLVFNYLKSNKIGLDDQKALVQLIKVVTEIDHFGECLWPDPSADRWEFILPELLDGLKNSGKLDDKGLIDFGALCLDGVFSKIKIKNLAGKDLDEGYQFKTKWGKAIGVLSKNNEVLKLGQKMGFVLVVQKDSQTEHIRIKARPDTNIDLTTVKEKLEKLDPEATWFLHISKKMLLNGSTKNPKMKPSSLSLKKVIEVLESI